MRLVDLLPDRRSAPWHCRECDGPLDLAGDDCSECVDRTLRERLEDRYQDGQGVTPMWGRGRLELVREFHPLHWRIGLDVTLDSAPAVMVSLGPWAFALVRDES